MRSGDKAVIGLAAYVVVWNLWASRHGDEMISEACDRYLACSRWRWLAEGVMTLVYLHVSNRIPERVDPIHWTFSAARKGLK